MVDKVCCSECNGRIQNARDITERSELYIYCLLAPQQRGILAAHRLKNWKSWRQTNTFIRHWSNTEENMKKLGSSRSLNKVRVKCEASSSLEFDQIKAVKTGWVGRLGDARRALSRKAKGFSPPSTSSSSTPCLFSTAPPPPKRAPSTTLTLRSKSMTAELEELGEYQKPCIKKFYTILFYHISAFPLTFKLLT